MNVNVFQKYATPGRPPQGWCREICELEGSSASASKVYVSLMVSCPLSAATAAAYKSQRRSRASSSKVDTPSPLNTINGFINFICPLSSAISILVDVVASSTLLMCFVKVLSMCIVVDAALPSILPA
jgi:hypothetical protein